MNSKLALFLLGIAFATSTAYGQAPAQPPTVTVEMCIVEIHTTKLRSLGFDWIGLPADQTHCLQSREFIKALVQYDLALFHAESVLVTQSGRPAVLEVGAVRLDAVPIVLGDDRINLEFRIEITKPPPGEDPLDSVAAPPEKCFAVQSTFTLESGKCCVAGGIRSRHTPADGKPNETEMLVIARASLGVPDRLSGRGDSSTPPTQPR